MPTISHGIHHEYSRIHDQPWYLWPDGRGPDGVPLETKYSRTKRKLYEVLDVRSVLYRASLVTPPPLRPVPGEQPYLVLNEDIYINW